jgi:hypothetical protein
LVERPAGAVGLHELGTHQEPAPAHLADDPLLAHRLLEPVAQARAHGLGVLDQVSFSMIWMLASAAAHATGCAA